ncbi:MAG: UDP-N-acetylmuramoyl-L-alanine--D-glutamate ligase [Thermodesulfobacteriota bacterium]|nr:UDP-N-acetylmuramoyl-L-alanine--D-glutamate ligase [Thermodesulfobacteriota bacterium]
MDIANKNILVVGLGRSGAAVACFLKNRGAAVTVTDIAGEEKLESYIPSLREMGISMELGPHRIETFESADLIIISPGVPHTILPIKRAGLKGIPVLGEIELASRFIREPIVAVTGTNGKTTTTTLLGEMLKKSGLSVFVGGNIGNPLIEYVDKGEKVETLIIEVSSFQLDTIDTFRPKVGVLLNIAEDHLDRYPDFAAYAKSKMRIFENQRESDIAVYNASDPYIRSLCKNIKSRKLPFNNNAIDNDKIEKTLKSLNFTGMSLQGKHNIENAYAASLAALTTGGTVEGVQSALNNFKGLPHRLEYVATINDVNFFNDSKATNVDAVARALEAFNKPVILIMGGRDKGSDFHLLEDLVRQHTKKIIVMGEAKEDIESALGHITSIRIAASMEDAVSSAYHAASPGDVVLLSPACASFDMYTSYAHRGEDFCKAVDELNK